MNKDFHCATAQEAENHVPSGDVTKKLASFFKIFGDDTRIRLLFALDSSELCVHDLSLIVGMQQSTVSHQLKLLREQQVVSQRREGKKMFYHLNDSHISEILSIAKEHKEHGKEEEEEYG